MTQNDPRDLRRDDLDPRRGTDRIDGRLHADADRPSMILFGEEADVHTERVESGRVRLRKRVVTEQIQVPVTVRREELDVLEEKVPDADVAGAPSAAPAAGIDVPAGAATRDAVRSDVRDMGDGELEITLYAERPVVTTEVVAVERVRVKKGVVTETREVVVSLDREEAYLEEQPGGVEPGHGTTRPRI